MFNKFALKYKYTNTTYKVINNTIQYNENNKT